MTTATASHVSASANAAAERRHEERDDDAGADSMGRPGREVGERTGSTRERLQPDDDEHRREAPDGDHHVPVGEQECAGAEHDTSTRDPEPGRRHAPVERRERAERQARDEERHG